MAKPHSKPLTGLALAEGRGRQAVHNWTKTGELLSGDVFASRLGLTKEELAAAEIRSDVFSLEVDNSRWYPGELLKLPRDNMHAICRAISLLTAGEKFIFWVRKHGAIGGKTVVEALPIVGVARVLWLAGLWVDERVQP